MRIDDYSDSSEIWNDMDSIDAITIYSWSVYSYMYIATSIHVQVSTNPDMVCFFPSAISIARSVPANEVADEVNRLSGNSVEFPVRKRIVLVKL